MYLSCASLVACTLDGFDETDAPDVEDNDVWETVLESSTTKEMR